MIEPFLEDLESRIQPEVEESLFQDWRRFTRGDFQGDIFSPSRSQSAPAALSWPHILVNDTLENQEHMALQQLEGCSTSLASGNGGILCVRCNYGTGILPSLFGVEPFLMARNLDTLPTNRALRGGTDAIKSLLDRGLVDIKTGLGGRVLEMGEYFGSLFKTYPKTQRHVHIYHPDLQGPMDVCELVWGSGLFLALVDESSLVKDFFQLITETYVGFMNAWRNVVPFQNGYAVHWSMLHQGHIMLRDDSAMNLSPEMFAEFILPFDQRLLAEFQGGALHFCGKGDHFVPLACMMKGLYAINMSQPEYNQMETIFQHTVDQGILLLALSRKTAEQALATGRDHKGRVHCW